jgi:hypothetical protein
VTTVGVRLTDGKLVWVTSATHVLRPADRVRVTLSGAEWTGTVVIGPDGLLSPMPAVAGEVIERVESQEDDLACDALPGADLPPLGSVVRLGPLEGVVTQLHPVQRLVTITDSSGEAHTLPFDGDSA